MMSETRRNRILVAILSEDTRSAQAAQAGCSRATLQRYLRDQDFRRELNNARERLRDQTLDELARRRAAKLAGLPSYA
jgi:hypothetical protein